MEAGLGPKPCERVDLDGGVDQGVAILKDLVGIAQMLAIPTRRITGIEDPQMLAPNAPPVFAVAWSAKTLVEARLGRALPREAVGLAINSKWARSQEQLHVHVDCVAIPVMKALAEYASALDSQWRAMTVPLQGRVYFARRVDSADLADVAPLKLLADGVEGARAHMGAYSLAAVGRDLRREARLRPAGRSVLIGRRRPRRGPSGSRLRDCSFDALIELDLLWAEGRSQRRGV